MNRSLAALALVLASAARADLTGTRESESPEPVALVTAGTLPPGTMALTAFAGQPLSGLRLDRGLLSWLDVGLLVDGDPARFIRPGLGARVRLVRGGCAGLTAVGAVGMVQALTGTYGPRPLARTGDAALGLQADLGLGNDCALGLFAQVEGLLDTDFSSTRTALFLLSTAGLEWSPWRKFSLLARAGQFRGNRGSRAMFAGGAAVRF